MIRYRTALARALAVFGATVACALGIGTLTFAQSGLSGPTVVPDRYEMAPGERVQMTIAGFRSDVVNMTFCGNEGRRGSTDCNVRGTQAHETNDDGTPTPAEMPVSAPPVPCPCILRVSSVDNLEVAVAPITLIGHPVADVVGGSEFAKPLSVDIVANPASTGLSSDLRSSLGGATTYDVTVQVANRATFPIPAVAVSSSYIRQNYDDTRSIDLPVPGLLEPGETWEQTVQVEVPSPTFGDVEWSATASGQGPTVTATDSTTSTPILLIVFGLILAIDLLILLVRQLMRVRRRRSDPPVEHLGATDPDDSGWMSDEATRREPELVS